MTTHIKSTMLVIAGLCWIAFAVVTCLFLYTYLLGGSGFQVFGSFLPPSSTTVLVGLVHFVGFTAAACLSFVIGVGLCAHGVVSAPAPDNKSEQQPGGWFAFLRRPSVSMPPPDHSAAGLRCVSCRVALPTPVLICPNCGWTQPRYHDAQ